MSDSTFFKSIRLLPFLLLFTSAFALDDAPSEAAPAATSKSTSQGSATELSADKTDPETTIQARVQVLGSLEDALKQPGSAHFIGKEELEKQEYSDIHRILRQVPGINIQEEDGYGLRPNIGMRGTGVERSQKITLMEDGILIAPAPYTAPAAYYFPTAGRMESVEVLKGSSSIKQGPYTNGGSLNMISTSIPGDFSARLNAALGSHDTRRFKAAIGDSYEQLGWLVETYQLDTAGFKELDNGEDTGVELNDYTAKLRFSSKPGAAIYQSLEMKLGKTTQFGDETYLGLTDADFGANPYRRYAGSQEDWIDTDHKQAHLRYFVKPGDNLDITTTVYFNDYFRNWHKLGSVNGVSGGTVLKNPDSYATELAILRGEIDSDAGALSVRNNRRNYESKGIQSVAWWHAETGGVNHDVEFGIRYHEDEEDRFQEDELFAMQNGDMILSEIRPDGSNSNRISEAEALSFFLQDTIATGRWTFRPGLRYETIDYTRTDYGKSDPDRQTVPSVRKNDVSVFLPGLGTDYLLTETDRIFVGIHRGFSPPGAGKNEDTKEEESTNYEFGYRHNGSDLRLELIGFFSDYDNLLGAETLSGGGTEIGELFNGGEVEVSGIEAGIAYDFGRALDTGLSIPFRLNYTYTTSEFKSSFDTSFADWSPSVEAGDELPYLPEHQLTAETSVRNDRWGLHLSANYVGEMRTVAGQGSIPENQKTDSRVVFDLSGEYTIFGNYRLFAQVRNVGDETYIVARRPYGVRPGLKRSFLFGVSANF